MATKKTKHEHEANSTMADRLTALPESLQLHILSSLETKYAVQTSMLSKSWLSSWTYIPILNFRSNSFKKLTSFDKFVFKTLSVRGPEKLDKLIFKRGGTCSAKILKRVFDYAFSQGVKELEVEIIESRDHKGWPIWLHGSDSLTSLKLESGSIIGCSFLEPRSGSFNNLTSLHLKRAIITDPDPFSGFPALEKLTLVCCYLKTDGNTLNINAPELLELTISYYHQYVNCCELVTPKLRYFECRGNNFPRLRTGGLPVLETVVIDYNGFCAPNDEKKMFDDLLMLFRSVCNAKSVTVSSSVVHLLTLFQDELVKGCSPFGDLKLLKLDFSCFNRQKLFAGPWRSFEEALKLLPGVKDYLLYKSRDAECTMVCPEDPHGPHVMLSYSRINIIKLGVVLQ